MQASAEEAQAARSAADGTRSLVKETPCANSTDAPETGASGTSARESTGEDDLNPLADMSDEGSSGESSVEEGPMHTKESAALRASLQQSCNVGKGQRGSILEQIKGAVRFRSRISLGSSARLAQEHGQSEDGKKEADAGFGGCASSSSSPGMLWSETLESLCTDGSGDFFQEEPKSRQRCTSCCAQLVDLSHRWMPVRPLRHMVHKHRLSNAQLPNYHTWSEGDPLPDRPWDSRTTRFQGLAELRVFCGIWNMHWQPLNGDLGALVDAIAPRHHIYVLGLAECNAKRQEAASEELLDWLGSGYQALREVSMLGLRLAVLVDTKLLPWCSDVRVALVPAGIGNIVPNKGSVQISFSVGQTRFLFMQVHLGSGEGLARALRRNQDLAQILKRSPLWQERVAEARSSQDGSGATGATTAAGERVFLFGDLNCRVMAPRETVLEGLQRGELTEFLASDELLRQLRAEPGEEVILKEVEAEEPVTPVTPKEKKKKKKKNRKVPTNLPPYVRPPGLWPLFDEMKIDFPPTYKMDPGTSRYDTSAKQRVPSWTDRVLWLKSGGIRALNYESAASILRRSDHAPVFVQCEVGVSFALEQE
eukprot:TRINITY_DN46271_c0_g1_i1.p1 TRINITY_DN46271_c0_g1~~TRINITY_DN46271_c0_g1_i1.p1  ORF type:complete len:593 (-),score=134.67 TRINITY_DN46271_c0_g1_i1:128-1906(-)